MMLPQHESLFAPMAIGKMKLENIKLSGCSIIATGCPACMIQIADMLSKSENHFAVKHPVEIYADFLKD